MAHSFITDPQVDINYLAVLVAASVNMAIGAIWYSSGVFGKACVKLSDMSEEKNKKMKGVGMGRRYFFGSLAALVTAFFLAVFVDLTGTTSVFGGVQAGFFVWIGFIATSTVGSVLWEGKRFRYYVLNNAYRILSLVVMGVIVAVWA